jgi:hypothetical protein
MNVIDAIKALDDIHGNLLFNNQDENDTFDTTMFAKHQYLIALSLIDQAKNQLELSQMQLTKEMYDDRRNR